MKKIMTIAPHPDDEVIGCGGTLLKHVSKGDKVYIIYLTNGEFCLNKIKYQESCEIRKQEASKVCNRGNFQILHYSDIPSRGILENYSDLLLLVVNYILQIKPDIIYYPHKDERDNDHSISNRLVKDAYIIYLNNTNQKIYPMLLCYEIWTPIQNIIKLNNISEFYDMKRQLINLYRSQSKINYSEAILSLNKYRAILNGINGFVEGYTYESV